jgi:hypothetical protein
LYKDKIEIVKNRFLNQYVKNRNYDSYYLDIDYFKHGNDLRLLGNSRYYADDQHIYVLKNSGTIISIGDTLHDLPAGLTLQQTIIGNDFMWLWCNNSDSSLIFRYNPVNNELLQVFTFENLAYDYGGNQHTGVFFEYTNNSLTLFLNKYGLERPLYYSNEDGTVWSQTPTNHTGYTRKFKAGIFNCRNKSVFKSTDGGRDFSVSNAGMLCVLESNIAFNIDDVMVKVANDATWINIPEFKKFAVAEFLGANKWVQTESGEIFYAKSDSIYQWNQSSARWSTVNMDRVIKPINNIYAAGRGLFLNSKYKVYFSNDLGKSWIDANLNEFSNGNFYYYNNEFYCTHDNNILKSSDGFNWETIKHNINFEFYSNIKLRFQGHKIYFYDSNNSLVHVLDIQSNLWSTISLRFFGFQERYELIPSGFDYLLFRTDKKLGMFSPDDAEKVLIFDDIDCATIFDVAIKNEDIYLFNSKGLWKRSLNELTGSHKETNTKFNIEVYPNPACDKIHVVLKEPLSAMRWKLLDGNGRYLRCGDLSASENTLSMDLSDVKAGIYVILVEVSGKWVSKRFVKI